MSLPNWSSYPARHLFGDLSSPSIVEPSSWLAAVTPRATTLFVRGELELSLSHRPRCVAIVGSRDASDEACAFARSLAAMCIARSLVVVSGGARGVDAAAHEGAVSAQGKSLVVFGTPIDDPYPARQVALFERVLLHGGAWLSEVPSGAVYRPSHFVMRNRLIAGLADAVVVVSAREKSGALITAEFARRFVRPLAVVSGAPWDERAVGLRRLVPHARIIGCLEEFSLWLSELGFSAREPVPGPESVTGSLQEWAARWRVPLGVAAATLTRGELEGWAYLLGSGRYLVQAQAPVLASVVANPEKRRQGAGADVGEGQTLAGVRAENRSQR